MNESDLREAVKGFLDATTPIIEHISRIEWKESDGMAQVIFRAVIKRQHESLSSIVEISDTERSYSGVSLLRPACEELIWIKYLKHIGIKDANELLRLLAVVEIGKTLEAQLEYVGPDVMKSIGFPAPFINAQAASVREAKRLILALGKRLKWVTKGKAEIPRVFFIAKATNNLEVYKFLYHATSKFVHFSVHDNNSRRTALAFPLRILNPRPVADPPRGDESGCRTLGLEGSGFRADFKQRPALAHNPFNPQTLINHLTNRRGCSIP